MLESTRLVEERKRKEMPDRQEAPSAPLLLVRKYQHKKTKHFAKKLDSSMNKNMLRKTVGDINVERIKRTLARVRDPQYSLIEESIWVNPDFKLTQFTRRNYEVFFGYYDKRQLSIDGEKLLAGCVNSRASKLHEPDVPMEVGFFDTNDGSFIHLSNTRAYSWQQGCMLRWLPQSNDQLLVFNDFQEEGFVTVLLDAKSGETVNKLPYATYDISPCSSYTARCDFSRLHKRRLGYGYWQNYATSSKEASMGFGEEVIGIHDLASNAEYRSIGLGEVLSAIGVSNSAHDAYVNHLTFSPDTTKLFFLFYWKEGSTDRSTSLIYDFRTDKVSVLNRNYMSHFCWEDTETLVAWGEDDRQRPAYYRYDTNTQLQTEYWEHSKNTDGHCTVLDDGTLLTDTYPDVAGFQTLIRKEQGQQVEILSRLYSPAKFSFDVRCDLHPRATTQRDTYTFDSAVSGRRATYLLSAR